MLARSRLTPVCRTALLLAGLFHIMPAWAAQPWGLTGEEVAPLTGTVVDIHSEVTGMASENCGGGKHQLGIRTAEGKLVPVIKNIQPFFGATAELLPHCGKQITVDGQFAGHSGYRIYVAQEIVAGTARTPANKGVAEWAESNGFAPGGQEAQAWYRHDPRVKAVIAKDGVFGVGPEADAAWLAEEEE